VTLPVVWIREADAELKEAHAWYENIRPELGERFARAVEATVEAITEGRCNSLSFTGDGVIEVTHQVEQALLLRAWNRVVSRVEI
jgi:hypothetical protein